MTLANIRLCPSRGDVTSIDLFRFHIRLVTTDDTSLFCCVVNVFSRLSIGAFSERVSNWCSLDGALNQWALERHFETLPKRESFAWAEFGAWLDLSHFWTFSELFDRAVFALAEGFFFECKDWSNFGPGFPFSSLVFWIPPCEPYCQRPFKGFKILIYQKLATFAWLILNSSLTSTIEQLQNAHSPLHSGLPFFQRHLE